MYVAFHAFTTKVWDRHWNRLVIIEVNWNLYWIITKKNPQKLAAARFLIANMIGNYSISPQLVETCKPFYEIYDSLSRRNNYLVDREWGRKIDRLWSEFTTQHTIWEKFQFDVKTVSASYLIKEIDLAFKSWYENVYTRNCSFDDFLLHL